ncbi:MAG: O-methyltransferase [Anaerolineae bacterium]|nr:O-methyltransferase [Anaerolineae bacterium]
MSREVWTAVDNYFSETIVSSDDALDAALARSAEAGLPSINVAANQGKLLAILARMINARTILEIGTLGGYSTIWLARTLPPGGSLITLEYDPKHAQVARENLAQAGLSDVVEIRVGRAADSLARLAAEGHAPFDLVFIDADKINNAVYFEWALKLTHLGSLIVCDNVVRNGKVVDADSDDESVRGVRQFMRAVAAEPRVTATAVQTVGSKGYDGLAIALVTGM